MTPDGLCHISVVPHGLQHPGPGGVGVVGVPGVGPGVVHAGPVGAPDPWGEDVIAWGLGGGGDSRGGSVLGRGGGKEKRV